ncbi:acyl--CoA ligase [Rhizobium sp. SSA_523]|nr:class I adenylate-forming enzyme family protein [Rhizobium sp. SSA_523]MCO5732571.1 acyl--CoA ligase [Rhizobium sp. SSA_523]WKC25810.1 class I adenylate-forming enzyme family protein [Rhizobium sp. SSA_523]
MRIESCLSVSARQWPDKLALVTGETRLTYGMLLDQVRRLSAGLASLGIGRGDRLLFVLENGAEAVIALFASWTLGAVACPLHPTIKAEKLADILSSTRAAAIITQTKTADIAEAALAKVGLARTQREPHLIVTDLPADTANGSSSAAPVISPPDRLPFRRQSLTKLMQMPGLAQPEPDLRDDELALLIHTSGSTGRPKGVMLTHANLHFAGHAIVDYLRLNKDDVVMSVLPLSFGYGLTQMLTAFLSGATLVLERSFAFPRIILDLARRERASVMPLVPAMAGMITAMRDLEPGALPHLRLLTSAAAAMPPATGEALQHLFPQAEIVLMYGQTECIRTAYLPPDLRRAHPLSVGRPLSGTQILIVDDNLCAVPTGKTGELLVRGPHVMAGYWEDAVATAKAIVERDGVEWLRTGDLFRLDESGLLYFISRKDDIIKTRGEKVSPQEVERVLYAIPGIVEAAVEGSPDPLLGQVVKAHVVAAPGVGLTERQIRRHCAESLEDFMVPKLVEFHESLPRTESGKIRLSHGKPAANPAWTPSEN